MENPTARRRGAVAVVVYLISFLHRRRAFYRRREGGRWGGEHTRKACRRIGVVISRVFRMAAVKNTARKRPRPKGSVVNFKNYCFSFSFRFFFFLFTLSVVVVVHVEYVTNTEPVHTKRRRPTTMTTTRPFVGAQPGRFVRAHLNRTFLSTATRKFPVLCTCLRTPPSPLRRS